jgi:peptide-methionine (R)-S-oxide reductase
MDLAMQDGMIGRRELLGLAGVGAAAVLFGSTSTLAVSAGKFQVNHTSADWQRLLGPERYAVLREAATERPFSSPLLNEYRKGLFNCAGCGLPLFSSATKFESGTGWPSFFRVLPNAIITRSDRTLGFERTEVLCRRCGGHLGHVFDDGPKPTGLRYCMNGLALKFVPA